MMKESDLLPAPEDKACKQGKKAGSDVTLVSKKKIDPKKRRRHPVAKVKGNWNAEDDRQLVRQAFKASQQDWTHPSLV